MLMTVTFLNLTGTEFLPFSDYRCSEDLDYIDVCESDLMTDAFITKWQTTTANEDITITLNFDIGDATVNYDINWGDGSPTEKQVTTSISHTYSSDGEHTIMITGDFPGIKVSEPVGNADKLLSIEQWGNIQWRTMNSAFTGAEFMKIFASDAPDLKLVTNTASMFSNCLSLDASLNHWNVQFVENMESMFENANAFNGSLQSWNTGNVTSMKKMFRRAFNFNKPIGDWNTSNVIDMSAMFSDASVFNQPIGNWKTNKVENMRSMFSNASNFNQSLHNWKTDNVTNMRAMFQSTENFNQSINNWNTSNVTDMGFMFANTSKFDQPLESWDTGNVTDMSFMFQGAKAFNQKIGQWNTSNVMDMSAMFSNARSFNQAVGQWNTSKVVDMGGMFVKAFSFNQPIETWDTHNVTSMRFMFSSAESFNQPLGKLNIKSVSDMEGALSYTNLSVANYDNTLIDWANQNLNYANTLGANNLAYCLGESARNHLVEVYGWTVEGDHFNCNGTGSCPTTQNISVIEVGNWGDTDMWSQGQVPSFCDEVKVQAYFSSSVKTDAHCFSLDVGYPSTFEVSTGSILEVWLGRQ